MNIENLIKLNTLSDIGGVLVGNKGFAFCVPNGKGDGNTKVVINENIDNDNELSKELDFISVCSGDEINIYSYDSSKREKEDILYTLLGNRYGIYAKNGVVLFERWREYGEE